MKFRAFSKIPQFNQIVKEVTHRKVEDKNGQWVYPVTKPTIKFKGTVKLHGTNAGFAINSTLEIKAIKRSTFAEGDHFGFNGLLNETVQKESIVEFFDDVRDAFGISDTEQLNVYGEWAGKGVQKNVAISDGKKAFYIFEATITSNGEEKRVIDVFNLYTKHFSNNKRVYHMDEFDTFEVVVDFNNPKLSQQKFHDLTMYVEHECPVAKVVHGVSGVGEGIVWQAVNDEKGHQLRFKTKGQKHSVTKTKTIAPVDIELLATVNEFADYVVTDNRVKQGIQEVGFEGHKQIGAFMKWFSNDIISEEADAMTNSELEWKQVAKTVQTRAREKLLGFVTEL